MSDINYSITMRVDKDFLSNTINTSGTTATMAVTGLQSVTYALSTATTTISTANLTAVGVAFIRNLATSEASTAQIGVTSGGSFLPFATLRGGEPAIMRLSSGASYQAIGTAGTRLRVDITEG